jgi:prepilin-type N-terminal cleavage/methylation domain-containing protein
MQPINRKTEAGFSLVELTIAMVVMLVLMAVVSSLLFRAMSVRTRESQTSDALASSQAALNVMSREISNSGFGLFNPATKKADNGIIVADSDATRIHFRANLTNVEDYSASMNPGQTNDPGEEVTYFHDPDTRSIVRYDPHGTPQTAVVVSRISEVTFKYWNYSGTGTITSSDVPTADTCRVEITVWVALDPVPGQPDTQRVEFKSQVNLRNAEYMLRQY